MNYLSRTEVLIAHYTEAARVSVTADLAIETPAPELSAPWENTRLSDLVGTAV